MTSNCRVLDLTPLSRVFFCVLCGVFSFVCFFFNVFCVYVLFVFLPFVPVCFCLFVFRTGSFLFFCLFVFSSVCLSLFWSFCLFVFYTVSFCILHRAFSVFLTYQDDGPTDLSRLSFTQIRLPKKDHDDYRVYSSNR